MCSEPMKKVIFGLDFESDNLEKIAEFRINGLVAATFTPFHDDGSLNLDLIDTYVDHLYTHQVTNVFVNGTTGEGMSLSTDERKLVAEKWMTAGREKLDKIIIHVGEQNLQESKELAAHAVTIGADAIACMSPMFFKPKTVDDLVEYMKQVADKAPDTPFYYYHLPSLTGVDFSVTEFFKKAKHVISTLTGVKFASTEFMDAVNVNHMDKGHYQVLLVCDELYLGAMALGIEWAVGSTYNFLPRVVHRMVEAFNRGNIHAAQIEQRRVQDAIRVMNKYGIEWAVGSTYNFLPRVVHRMVEAFNRGNMHAAQIEQRRVQEAMRVMYKYGSGVAVLKEFLPLLGLNVGPPRLPLKPLDNQQKDQFKQDLIDIGYFEWIQDIHKSNPMSPKSKNSSFDHSRNLSHDGTFARWDEFNTSTKGLIRATSFLTDDDEPNNPKSPKTPINPSVCHDQANKRKTFRKRLSSTGLLTE